MLKSLSDNLSGKALLTVIILVLWGRAAEAQSLSDSSSISVLTCSPGTELYSGFGHSGIRVTDYRTGMDIVFNYGTFDFNQPNFYLNFCRGHMIYMLGVDRFLDFKDQYIYEQRNIAEQQLNLSLADRQGVFDYLVINAREENRNYRYDFLFDNCSTRIRDVFQKTLGTRLGIDYSSLPKTKSFRDLINDYSETNPWAQFGMGLLIGLPVDQIASPSQVCFLPDYLSQAFDHASLDGKPLCTPSQAILKASPLHPTAALDQEINPTLVFIVLLLIVAAISMWELKQKVHYFLLDSILYFIAGILGCLFLALGYATEHSTTSANLNLLWALPTHLLVSLLLPFFRSKRWIKTYFLISTLLCLVLVVGWKLLPQHFLFANVCIASIYTIRGLTLYRYHGNS